MSTIEKMTRLGLIRHAKTEWNQAKRIQGHEDSPLTPEGETQAANWGRLLKPIRCSRILSSDIGRASKTAAFINRSLQVPVNQDLRLREQDWGEWTGKRLRQIEHEILSTLPREVAKGWRFCPPAGEDRNSVWDRSHTAVADAARRWPGETILVVTHEGVIKCLIYRLLGRRFLPSEPPVIKPQHLHWLTHDRKGLRLKELNALELK